MVEGAWLVGGRGWKKGHVVELEWAAEGEERKQLDGLSGLALAKGTRQSPPRKGSHGRERSGVRSKRGASKQVLPVIEQRLRVQVRAAETAVPWVKQYLWPVKNLESFAVNWSSAARRPLLAFK